MTTPKKIDPLYTDVLNMWADQIVRRTLHQHGLGDTENPYDPSEHAEVSAILDTLLETATRNQPPKSERTKWAIAEIERRFRRTQEVAQ